MINLNRLAFRIREKYLQCRLMTCDTSEKAKVLRISSSWRKLNMADKLPSKDLPKYTEKEVAAADIILDTLEYLKSIGKKDIEGLLRDRIENLESD